MTNVLLSLFELFLLNVFVEHDFTLVESNCQYLVEII